MIHTKESFDRELESLKSEIIRRRNTSEFGWMGGKESLICYLTGSDWDEIAVRTGGLHEIG